MPHAGLQVPVLDRHAQHEVQQLGLLRLRHCQPVGAGQRLRQRPQEGTGKSSSILPCRHLLLSLCHVIY